jgi:adenylate cyclase
MLRKRLVVAPSPAPRLTSGPSVYRDLVDDDERAWVDLGLYDPEAPGAADRLATLRFLRDRGATTDELRAADADGVLPGLAADLRMRRVRRTPREVAAKTGVPLEQVRLVLRAVGLGDPGLDDPALLDTDVETVRLAAAAVELFGLDATLQFSRVLGAALTSVAEAAMTIFGQNLAPSLDAEGASELARAQTSDLARRLLVDEVPGMMADLFLHFVERAARRAAVSGASATSDLTVAFVDLVGSTALAERLSPAELGGLIGGFERDAAELVAGAGGQLVKTIGDEVMYVLTDAAAACLVALELRERVDDHPELPQLRGGVAAGGLVRGYADYYGPVVNTAARAVKLAPPGAVWATDEVRRRAAGAPLAFEPLGEHVLRGFDRPVALFAVRRR